MVELSDTVDEDLMELCLAVFRESEHPRIQGRFVTKGLGEGLTKLTKGKVVQRGGGSWLPGKSADEVMKPLKAVEHKEINKHLREAGVKGKPISRATSPFHPDAAPGEHSTRTQVTKIDYIMGDSATKKDMTVLRAVPPADVEDKAVGDKWVEHGFVSTSKSAEGNQYFTDEFSTFKGGQARAYLKISVPKGTHAFDYGPNDPDHELVLDRGLEYEVTGEERDPDGNRVLLVKVHA